MRPTLNRTRIVMIGVCGTGAVCRRNLMWPEFRRSTVICESPDRGARGVIAHCGGTQCAEPRRVFAQSRPRAVHERCKQRSAKLQRFVALLTARTDELERVVA